MRNDDYFFNLGPAPDTFPNEIEAVVTSMYQVTIEGIELLDERERAGFNAGIDFDQVIQQKSMWLEERIQALKHHAGNMALVSLVILFDDWIVRQRQDGKNLINRFTQLVKRLPESPLTVPELENMVTARNSIIHHRGKSEFTDDKGKARSVNDQFLDFDTCVGERRVAVEQTLLDELVGKVTSFVKLWNRQMK